MGHIPDDENNDEFMNASAEEWSKSEPAPAPETPAEDTNRWGAPIPDPTVSGDAGRWGSEQNQSTSSSEKSSAKKSTKAESSNDKIFNFEPKPYESPAKKGGSKWWIILIVVLVVLCLCACLVVFGLPALGISLFDWSSFQY